MTAPTQAYPPWLSKELVTVTQDGATVVQTSVVQLPQTYYGPSIPLDSDWVYGGSTFPASIATSFGSPSPIATPEPSTSALPTSSQSPVATSASPSASPMTPVVSSSPTTTLISTPAASTSPSMQNSSISLSAGTRLAAILSTILGTLLLAALLIVLLGIRRRARQRRLGPRGVAWSWPSAQRDAEAGEDEDENEETSFVSREQSVRPASIPSWPPRPLGAAISRPRASAAETKSDSSLDSEAKRDDIARFNASSSTADVGSLFFNPRRGSGEKGGIRKSDEAGVDDPALGSPSTDHTALPPGAAPPNPLAHSPSPPLTPTALHFRFASPHAVRLDDRQYDNDVQRLNALRARENMDDDGNNRLLSPPQLTPEHHRTSDPSPSGSPRNFVYPDSPSSETDERAALLTARFVRVDHAMPVMPTSHEKDLEGWITPPNQDDEEKPPVSPSSWSVSMGGLAGFARGLGRLSWFRRMDDEAGPSGTRHSSPSRSRPSRSSSMASLVQPSLRPRPRSALLRPSFSRPHSGVSFRSIDDELGLRPPGMRISATGSGSGSGKSVATMYHSVSSRPRSAHIQGGPDAVFSEGQVPIPEPMMITLPPDLDLGEGRSTIRSVDVLDIPIPERTFPFATSLFPGTSSDITRKDTVSSEDTNSGAVVAFPPGLVSVSKWDKESHSGSSDREPRDALEEEPPKAGGEWSSLRSKTSMSDVRAEGHDGEQRSSPMTRSSSGEQPVQVVVGEPAPSETASIGTGSRQPPDQRAPAASTSSRPPTGVAGISPSSRISTHESSHSDVASHSRDSSYSSRLSRAASHSQGFSQSSSHHDSEETHPPLPTESDFNRASLSAFGIQGLQGPPQLPPMRPLSNLQMLAQTSEDRETEGSDTSRPGTETSKPLSDQTQSGTFASGSGNTSTRTTLPSTPAAPSTGKR